MPTSPLPGKRGRKRYWPKEEAYVSVGIRLPKSVHTALTGRAKANFRSLNAELTMILAQVLEISLQ